LRTAPIERIADAGERLTCFLGEFAKRVAWIAETNRMGSSGVEVMRVLRPTRISRYLSVLLADLVSQFVEVDQIENLSHRLS
jgi:hypothetical protein